jgi:hypothetical protein
MKLGQLLLLATTLLLSALSPAQVAPPVFSISISVEPTVAKAGTPIELAVTLTNVSNHQISVAQEKGGKAEFDYRIDVRNSSNTNAPDTNYHKKVKGQETSDVTPLLRSWGFLQVDPGKTLKDHVDLTRLFQLAPGKYTVQVERTDDESKATVKSNTVLLTINP